jgi:hypothetical protein
VAAASLSRHERTSTRAESREASLPPAEITTSDDRSRPLTPTIDDILRDNERLMKEIQALRQTIRLKSSKEEYARFLTKTDEDVRVQTGFSSVEQLQIIFDTIVEGWQPRTKTSLEPFAQFVLTMQRLRLGTILDSLAKQFEVSRSTACAIFHDWLEPLCELLKDFVRIPSRRAVRQHLPQVFKDKRFRNVRGIIDCTEFFTERPSNLLVRKMLYSSYKHHSTVKALIVVAPSGAFTYISPLFGGRSSDKFIVSKCGFLDLVEEDDVYLVDRGFLCHEFFASRGARILMPARTRRRPQLPPEELHESSRLASARVHVERAIGRLKTFGILSNTIPISLLKHGVGDSSHICSMDKILLVCAAICNLRAPLIAK